MNNSRSFWCPFNTCIDLAGIAQTLDYIQYQTFVRSTQLSSSFKQAHRKLIHLLVGRRTVFIFAKEISHGKVTDYGAGPAARVTAYRLILDLPPEICQKIASGWFMGAATVEPLDTGQIAALAADLAAQPVAGGKATGRRMWETSRGLAQRCQWAFDLHFDLSGLKKPAFLAGFSLA